MFQKGKWKKFVKCYCMPFMINFTVFNISNLQYCYDTHLWEKKRQSVGVEPRQELAWNH